MRMQKRVWLFLFLLLLLLLIFVDIMMLASMAEARVLLSQEARGRENEEDELVRLGSRPPNCEHKCKGCVPCISVQVPTTTDHLRPLYANYEPEGWKCKCGTTFYNP